MQNPDPAIRSRIIHLVIAKRKKSILKTWIQENGIPYKCVEMLYAIMDRKPVYAHEQPTRQMEQAIEHLRQLSHKMEALALVADDLGRKIRSAESPVRPDDLETYLSLWRELSQLFQDFAQLCHTAAMLKSPAKGPIPIERYRLDEIFQASGSHFRADKDQAFQAVKEEFTHRPFTVRRISAWEDFSHDVLALTDSVCFLLEIILKEGRVFLEALGRDLPSRPAGSLESLIGNLENMMPDLSLHLKNHFEPQFQP